MVNPILHTNAVILCTHGAQVRAVVTQQRVRVGGQPVATLSDQYPISGCPFVVALKPQPCVVARWVNPARRVRVGGQPVLLSATQGTCFSAENSPQGKPNPTQYQVRVRGE